MRRTLPRLGQAGQAGLIGFVELDGNNFGGHNRLR
jgi:hypothetical protein